MLRNEHLSRAWRPRVMFNGQYDWLRTSTEPCRSMCKRGRMLRSSRLQQHQHELCSHSVWLPRRYQSHRRGATSCERLTGSLFRSPIPPLFAMVECLVPSDRKPGGVLVIAKRAPRTFRSWVGRTEESDEHLVVNEIGHVVSVSTARRCVENENSGPDVVKLAATPTDRKPDGDDVEAREMVFDGRMQSVRVSTHTHLVRCEARRYEHRQKYGRNPVTTRRVHHDPELWKEQDLLRVKRILCAINIKRKSTDCDRRNFSHTCETFAFGRETTRSESRKFRDHSRFKSAHGCAITCTLEHETKSS